MAHLKHKSAVLDRVRECWKLVNEQPRFAGFPCPDVTFFDKGRAAGRAYLREGRISIHETLLVENFDSMIRETVAHEVAHLVTFWQWNRTRIGRRPQPHGSEWRTIMSRVLLVEPERTHNYDMTNVQVRRQRRFAYACPCRVHKVTTVKHNKLARGGRYVCAHCKSQLNFLGEVQA